MRKHSETLAVSTVFAQLELCMQIFVWTFNGDFHSSNFDLSDFNKYHMDFNPVKCITKYKVLTGKAACGMFIKGE